MKRKQFYLPESQIKGLEEESARTGSSVSEVLRKQLDVSSAAPTPIQIINTPVPQTETKASFTQHNCTAESFGKSYASQVTAGDNVSTAGIDDGFYFRGGDDSNYLQNYSYLRFNNLVALRYPYQNNNGFINIREAVRLCQTAWYNVSAFKNTIETMVCLANSGIKLYGGTQEGRDFFAAWFDKINLFRLTEQFFRETFRSSNMFLYRYDGGIKSNRIDKFVLGQEDIVENIENIDENKEKTNKKKKLVNNIKEESTAAKTIDIPVRYIVLDPAGLCLINNTDLNSYNPVYYRLLDVGVKQEIRRLQKNSDVKVTLDKSLTDILNNDFNHDNRLNPEHLYPMFYQKQDYEPFALPMAFPVLSDINLKLELKKCDAVVAKTVESIIMLVTHGEEPDKGGMNPVVDQALKTVFRTKQVGRTLVSDYTTKIDFIIPDINKVMGPAKYEQLDRDINEGLSNIFFGEKKLANIGVKVKLFINTLVYAQKIFLTEFLIGEVNRVGKLVGFKDDEIPTPRFLKIQMEDRANNDRIITQLAQLGILSAEDTLETLDTGILPSKTEMEISQKRYKKQRDDGLFYPLVGGSQTADESGGTSKTPVKSGKKLAATNDGRPKGVSAPKTITASESKYKIDVNKFRDGVLLANKLTNDLTKSYVKKFGDSEDKYDKIKVIATHLITNELPENWLTKIKNYIKEIPAPNMVNVGLAAELKEQNEIEDDFTASLLIHCVV